MEFLSQFESNRIHILGISETHLLKDLVLDGELNILGYKLQRKDCHTGEGSGVAVYMKNTLSWP